MEFTHRTLRAAGKKVHRLGLACNMGIDEAGIRHALDRGINYVLYTPIKNAAVQPALRDALARDREKYVVAGLPLVNWFGGSVRRTVEGMLKDLHTDYLDVYQLGWLGVASAWTDGVIKELVHLKETGKVKALGTSIHDRERAGNLAEDSVLDLFMIRYNAAHPGAERDIFPHLERRHPSIVAYTATRWRKLLKAPRGWTGRVPTAGDCYRFCLSNPNVDVVLSGPADARQLDENMAALEKGPLSDEDLGWMREFGKVVHG
ncbi:MAG: aldo/keto reductase [Deltaproteobacteria bacterium]|nr:aldo/keto reductase [Deltaproteobacteria bacterium]